MRRIGRNNFPIPLGRRNGSLCEQRRLAGSDAEGVRTSFLLRIGLLPWAAPVSWMLVLDCAKQESPPSDF